MTPSFKIMPPVKIPGTAAAMIAVATSQVGYREGENNDTAFGQWYGLNHASWCAEFISWAAIKSGCGKMIPKHAYTPSGANWFKSQNRWGTKPRVGAIVYFYNASEGRIAHVGVVTKVFPNGSFLSCEGNTNNTGSRQGNGVYLQRRISTRGGGFGYPSYKKNPNAPVNLKAVIAKVKETGRYYGRVASALLDEGLAPDKAGYAKWQVKLRYHGSDADGISGEDSLKQLGKKHGWSVKV